MALCITHYRLDTRRNCYYRLEPGDIGLLLSPRTHATQFMIIALNLEVTILVSPLTHAGYDYREPGDIDIIITLTHATSYDYRLEPGISILLSP
jgi:hypothetical protein